MLFGINVTLYMLFPNVLTFQDSIITHHVSEVKLLVTMLHIYFLGFVDALMLPQRVIILLVPFLYTITS